jgi:DNA-binding NarL/FixJ family response regulator
MQTAREWIARTETRLEELNRQAQDQARLIKPESGKKQPREKGAPPVGDRENIIKLARQGWTVEEIAKTMKVSRGEVELILEIDTR